jgi:hypothetical protein
MRLLFKVFAVAVFLSGCATYNGKMLKKVDFQAPQNKYAVSYKAESVIATHEGGGSVSIVDSSTGANGLLKAMVERWNEKGVLSSFGKPGELNVQPNYELTVSGYIHETGSMFAALMTELSGYLIPSSLSLTYDMDATLVDTRSHKTYKVPFKNSITIWKHFSLLFAAPFTASGMKEMAQDTADYLYFEFRKQGAFN